MKTTYRIFLLIIFVSFATLLFSQDDFQNWQVRVSEVTSKAPEKLNQSDLDFLKSIVNMTSSRFGNNFQKIVDDKKIDAKRAIRDYDNYHQQLQNQEAVERDLSTEKIKTEAQSQVISAQGDTIISQTKTIEQLRNELSDLKNQLKKISKLNNKMKNEKVSLETMLDENRQIAQRMKSLFTRNAESDKNLPSDLKSDLERTECEIADLMKNNYLMMIEKLKADTKNLDSLRNYYQEKKMYPDKIAKYITDGEQLASKFASGTTDCVKKNSSEIMNSISEIKTLIESNENNMLSKFFKFLISPVFLGMIIAVLATTIVVLMTRNKKKQV